MGYWMGCLPGEQFSLSCAISFSNTNYDHHGKKTHFQIEENPETEARSGRAVESSCHERMLSEWQSKQEAGSKALCCPFKGWEAHKAPSSWHGRSKPFWIHLSPVLQITRWWPCGLAHHCLLSVLLSKHEVRRCSHPPSSHSHQGPRGWDTSFKALKPIFTFFRRNPAKQLRCVIIDSPDARRHCSVTAFIPVAYILIWIISLLVSEHHGSFPSLQALRQDAELTQHRDQPVNAGNTKTNCWVTCTGWTFCCRNAQIQLLQFAQEEELKDWARKAVVCSGPTQEAAMGCMQWGWWEVCVTALKHRPTRNVRSGGWCIPCWRILLAIKGR